MIELRVEKTLSKFGGDWGNYLRPIEKAIVDHDQFGDGGFQFVDSANRGTHHYD